MKESGTFETGEERDDVYGKMKNTFDFCAAIVDDEKRSHIHRIRAAKSLSTLAKTLRVYILDEERWDELEERMKKLEKTIGFTEDNNEQQ